MVHHRTKTEPAPAPRRSVLRFFLPGIAVIAAAALQGCFIIRPFAGADVNIAQLQKAREATVLQVRLNGARRLSDRMANGDPVENADMTFSFSEALLNKAASQLDSTDGWLDSLTSYSIKSIRVKLYNGSAIATIAMTAHSHEYNVKVNLLMDCLLAFSVDSGAFSATLEPFNVVPNVKAKGITAALEGIIQDVVTAKLSTISDNLPPIRFPVDFTNQFPVQASSVRIRTGLNMNISTPAQTLQYALELKEVLIFKERLFVAMNVKHAGVVK